ncbi:MAG: fibronectin type III domain-containing protein [Treponema sp.]|nr:fibronectin type III domain-containing protein [Treponema sp.]
MKRITVISRAAFFSFLLFTSCHEPAIEIEKPTKPGRPTLTPHIGKLDVTWSSVPGANEYHVYYNSKPEFPETSPEHVITVQTTSVTIDGLANGSKCYVWVKARNKGGDSYASDMAEVTIPSLGVPKPSLAQGDGRLIVTWDPVDSAESYAVYYNTSESQPSEPYTTSEGTSVTIDELVNKTTYYVWVKALHRGGNSALSERAQATLTLSTPSKPTLTPRIGELGVAWSPVSNVSEYRVYYNTRPEFPETLPENVITVQTPPTTIGGLVNKTTYYVWVVAHNNGGDSSVSEMAEVMLPSLGVPGKPSLTQGDGCLTVAWNAVDSAESYAVYYGTSESPSSAVSIASNGTSITIEGLVNKTTYYVWVKALHRGGDSLLSERAQATLTLSAPGKPTLTPRIGELGVAWSPVSGVSEYRVYYNTRPEFPETSPNNAISVQTTSTTIEELDNGRKYYIWVVAQNSGGASSASEMAEGTLPSLGVPSKPSLTQGDGCLVVVWNAVDSAESYAVYYGVSESPPSEPHAEVTASEGTSLTIGGLVNETTYYVWVQALHRGGDSALSERAQMTLRLSTPGKPTLTPRIGELAVAWNPVDLATSYRVYYNTEPEFSETPPNNIMTVQTTSVTIGELDNGRKYYIWVVAHNNGGASSASEMAEGTLPSLGVPSKPSLTQGDGCLIVAWNAVDSAESYAVYYGTSESSSSAVIVASNGTSVTIEGLVNETTYYVWVEAVHRGGNSLLSERAQMMLRLSAPGKPTLTPRIGELAVAWNPVDLATSYRVYYAPTAVRPSEPTLTVTESEAVIVGLTYETTYYVWVQAANTGGVSAPSESSTGTPLASVISIKLDEADFGGNNEPSFSDMPSSIRRVEKKDYTLTVVDDSWDSYEWRLDGTTVSRVAAYTFNSFSPELTVGYHTLIVIVQKNNRAYSKTIKFLVTN